MNVRDKARRLESRVARAVEDAVQRVVGDAPRQPLEIVEAVVDAAAQQVQPAGRGRSVFPFTRVVVHVAAQTPVDRARFAALAETPPSLEDRIIARLSAAGCAVPSLQVTVDYRRDPEPDLAARGYEVEFERAEFQTLPPPARQPVPPRIELSVQNGAAERKSYVFVGGRIDIGRRAEIVDHRQRLIRTNHIAFSEEGSGPNRSVSRKHAHIIYDAASGEYRVRDDGSAHGTALLRNGRMIRVPPGARGARLQTSDEIALGDARLRVKIK